MMFNKATKQAFVHPPKTGTHTIQKFLIEHDWKKLPMTHARTERLIRDYPNLNDYTIYGFLRDPLERFESAILHVKRSHRVDQILARVLQQNGIADSVETVSYETLIGIFPAVSEVLPAFFRPQSAWLDHPKVTVLDFRNIDAELRRIAGNTDRPIVRQNVATNFGKSVITRAVEDFVRDHYAPDYALMNSRLGAKDVNHAGERR